VGGRAVSRALASKVLVIAGGLGVGKTIIVDSIVRILAANGVVASNIFKEKERHVASVK
jgi:tRNA A37 threonylcarbamoyladenosine biosynthesis protein TsaE